MDQLYSSFIKLCLNNKADSNQISVMDIPDIDNHKIGVDQESYLNLLIKSTDSGDIFIPVRLEFIEVYYDILCEIEFRGEVSQKNYSIIKLKTDDNILQKYFINIIYLYIKELGEEPTLLEIQKKKNSTY